MIKVLVIDDQESIKIGLTLLLKKKGFYAKSADSVEAALPLLKGEIFKYIVSDLKMPGLSGLELAKELNKQNYPALIILVSAYFSVEDAIEALRLKISDMFAKPVDNNLIINRIEELDREVSINRSHVDVKKEISKNFKFMRSFVDTLLFTTYYSQSINSFQFICHRINEAKIRYCIISNVSNEMSGFIRGFFELFNSLDNDFSQVEGLFESLSSFNYIKSSGIGVLFGEINSFENTMKVFAHGDIEVTVAIIDENAVTLVEIDNVFKELSGIKDFFVLIHNNLKNTKSGVVNRSIKKDVFSLKEDFFLFDDFQIVNLMKDFPLIDSNSSFILLQSFDCNKNRKFVLDVFIENLNLEYLFKFIKIHIELYINSEELKVIILSSIAEIVSRLYHNGYKHKFQIILSVLPGQEVKVRIAGDDFYSYIDLTQDIQLDDLASFTKNFSFIEFNNIMVSDKMIEIGASLR